MKFAFVIGMFFIVISSSFSQTLKAKNVHYRLIDDKIEVFYDLPANHDSLEIKVEFRKKSDSDFRYQPKYTGGDIGIGIFSGKSKKIVWHITKEPPSLFTGSEFYFSIYAIKIPKIH